MSFGNVITDGTQQAVGTNGYIVSFDLSGESIKTCNGVQLQNSVSLVLSEISIASVELATLQNYPEDADCPELAFSQNDSVISVFCKTSSYPYTSQTRIAFWFSKNTDVITTTSDNIIPNNMPASAMNLLMLKCIKDSQILMGMNVSRDIQQQINKELISLNLV